VEELERRSTVTRLGQGVDASGALADAAEANRAVITAACRASLRRWPRLLSAIDPRPALARLRDDRAAKRRPRPTTT